MEEAAFEETPVEEAAGEEVSVEVASSEAVFEEALVGDVGYEEAASEVYEGTHFQVTAVDDLVMLYLMMAVAEEVGAFCFDAEVADALGFHLVACQVLPQDFEVDVGSCLELVAVGAKVLRSVLMAKKAYPLSQPRQYPLRYHLELI